MQQEYTLDSVFKLTLWLTLLKSWRAQLGQAGGLTSPSLSHGAELYLWAALPLRQSKLCCVTGTCGGTSRKVHRLLNLARSEVKVMTSIRDEACVCLANSCACLKPPLNVHIRGYFSASTGINGEGRFDGLRALLLRLSYSRVSFWAVSSAVDSQQIASEIAQAAYREVLRPTPWRALALGEMPAFDQVGLITALQAADHLTEVALEHCGVDSLVDIAAYVAGSTRLVKLSLKGNKAATHWDHLSRAAGANTRLRHLDVSLCRWTDDVLREFIAFGGSFAERESFFLDVSRNSLQTASLAWMAEANESFRMAATGLNLSGHSFRNCSDAVATLLATFPRLSCFYMDNCGLGFTEINRLTKAWGKRSRGAHETLSFVGNSLGVREARLVCAALGGTPSAASVNLSGNSFASGITKLGLHVCMASLHTLELSACGLGDEGLLYVAGALEKSAPLPLVKLDLSDNVESEVRGSGKNGFQFLARALRHQYAPQLATLSLSCNVIALKSLATLLEQVSPTLQLLDLSSTSVAACEDAILELAHCAIKRQKGPRPFRLLDIDATSDTYRTFNERSATMAWLSTQEAIRFILSYD